MSHIRTISPWHADTRRPRKWIKKSRLFLVQRNVVFALEDICPHFSLKSDRDIGTVSTWNAKQSRSDDVHFRARSRETRAYASTMRSTQLESLVPCTELFSAIQSSDENRTRFVNESVKERIRADARCRAYFSLDDIRVVIAT